MTPSLPLTEQTDEQLMAAYLGGDSEALRSLFERYAPVLIGMARRRYLSEEDAGDLVQQTFCELHRARRVYQQGRPLRPWLMTIAMNLMRDEFRRRQRRPETLVAELPVRATTEPGALTLMHHKEIALAVRAAVSKLPEKLRDVIELHWFDELSYPEIATLLDVNVSAIKVRAHRAYKRLRKRLEGVLEQSTPIATETFSPAEKP